MQPRSFCRWHISSYYVTWKIVFIVLFIFVSIHVSNAKFIYPSELPSSVNFTYPLVNEGDLDYMLFSRLILFQGNGVSNPCYLAGFICVDECKGYLFAVVIAYYHQTGIRNLRVVWSANKNWPVDDGAKLQLTKGGNLELRNRNDALVWFSKTTRKSSVASFNLTESGNLLLLDENKSIIWQSFDHPTDTLLMGQKLSPGQMLTSSLPGSNTYSLLVNRNGVFAFIDSNIELLYYKHLFTREDQVTYIELVNGSVRGLPKSIINSPRAVSTQFMQLLPDGHLKLFEYQFPKSSYMGDWAPVGDILGIGECSYPMVCGKYGVCKYDKQCSCPVSSDDSTKFFRPISEDQPNQGCSEITPVSCNASGFPSLLEFTQLSFFPMRSTEGIESRFISTEDCKKSCLRNCSCKLAMYINSTCFLSSDVYSLMGYQFQYQSTLFLKVQNVTQSHRIINIRVIIGVSATGFCIFIVIIGGLAWFILRNKQNDEQGEDDNMEHVVGMLSRYSLDELKVATDNFSKKLGQGGFGSVYEGVLRSGIRVAVKRLHEVGQIERSFMAEVESIGSIHHVNLVRLVGFCAEKFNSHLVYEYMKNGSLDKWIYSRNQSFNLKWNCRKNIIKDVAHGLAYLHEECRQKIVHLDVKPQNILLDENLNAKLSDFGLAKLIERNQSKVVTVVRGTPGYLAPEWLSGVVTDKVDVYSFGVVLLEILCGRRIFEESEPEEYQPLVSLFKIKAEEGRLSDLVDKCSEDMKAHVVEIVEMMQLAVWCLQIDRNKRPTMANVVKVLDGVMDVDGNLDVRHVELDVGGRSADSAPPLPSVLSGPR